jgi:hypothetical protein
LNKIHLEQERGQAQSCGETAPERYAMVDGYPPTPSPETEERAGNEGEAAAPVSGWVSNTPKGRALELINDGWNEICAPTGLPKTLPTHSLLAMAVRRLREHPELEWWQVVLEEIATNPFYHGRNNYGWDADFDRIRPPWKMRIGGPCGRSVSKRPSRRH